jgi:hypothetical protein
MKRVSAVLAFFLFVSGLAFAQSQTGDATYNSSKQGLAISHSSLSFNTRVKVTNLRNNLSSEAVVNGRIPITTERIADISRELGDAIGMAKTGMTLVEIEILFHPAAASGPVQEVQPPAPSPRPAPQPAPQPPPPQPQPSAVDTQTPAAAPPVQTVISPQYIPFPSGCSPCCIPLMVVIICLMLVVIILLVILIVFFRRLLWWPWYHPVWLRRHILYAKKHRRN